MPDTNSETEGRKGSGGSTASLRWRPFRSVVWGSTKQPQSDIVKAHVDKFFERCFTLLIYYLYVNIKDVNATISVKLFENAINAYFIIRVTVGSNPDYSTNSPMGGTSLYLQETFQPTIVIRYMHLSSPTHNQVCLCFHLPVTSFFACCWTLPLFCEESRTGGLPFFL